MADNTDLYNTEKPYAKFYALPKEEQEAITQKSWDKHAQDMAKLGAARALQTKTPREGA